ncbi:MAG TPA: ABC transporter permease [Acidimicrobiia bacterium]|jgi:peptide/nickel transport system permease protein
MSRIDVTTADIDIFDAPVTGTEREDFEAEAHEPAPRGHGLRGFLRRVWTLPSGVKIGGSIVGFFVLVAVFAPVLAPYGPQEGELADRLQGVGTAGHLLGTDGQGRDLLSRLIWGARPSLTAGILPVLFAALIGTSLGLVAGLGHRRTHGLIMRTLDVVYAFPAVLLAISIAAALGVGVTNVIIALSIVLVAPIARVVETEVIQVRGADFMDAARASGAGAVVTASKQVVPNILPTLVVYCTSLIGLAIVYAAGLSFLGLGVAPPNPEWGAILNDLRQNLYDEPMLALVPAAVIFIASVGFNVLGDGLRELLNVKEMA